MPTLPGSGGEDGSVTQAAPSTRPATAGVDRWWAVAGAVLAVALVPLCFLGPGTDLDVGAVLRSGQAIAEEGTYRVSRAPGAPVHEAAVGVLHRLAGTVGPNLGSLAAGVGLVAALAALLRREGVGRVGLSVAVVAANPWTMVAATSTVDFLWALGLWAAAALVLRARPGLGGAAAAGVLAGLAVGCRGSTAFLVAGLALTEALDRDVASAGADEPPTPPPWARAAVLLGVAGLVGLVVFLPPFLSSDASLAFAQNDVAASSLPVQVGRFLAKDLYLVGPFAAVALAVAAPAVVRTLRRARADWLVRLGLVTLVVSQVLFLRFPWKVGHLLPSLVALALLLARALDDRPRLHLAVVATQLLYALVSIQLLAPDTPNRATGGRLTFEPGWGVLVVDTRCRLDDPDAWQGLPEEAVLAEDDFDEGAAARLGAVWDCAKPWASG